MSLDDPNAAAAAALVSNIPGAAGIIGPGNGIVAPLISPRDYFLQTLEDWYTTIPMGSQWLMLFDRFPQTLTTSIIQNLERIDGSANGWDIDRAVEILTSNANQKIIGCAFAQNIQIPPENYAVDTVTIPNNRGFLPGVIGSYRDSGQKTLTIDFRESNTSFVDFVIRPWTILASHYGMVARPGDTATSKDPRNMKVNITVLQYAKTLANVNMVPRKVWTFFNCIPYNVSNESLDYGDEEFITYQTQWAYTNYTVENNLYLPIGDILNLIG